MKVGIILGDQLSLSLPTLQALDKTRDRLVMAEVPASPSAFMEGMAGSRMPIAVAHGEGRVEFPAGTSADQLSDSELIALRLSLIHI